MASRTVRLDAETERVLASLQRKSGQSVSVLLKRGLVALAASLEAESAKLPYDLYADLDLGPGGSARAPASKAKEGIRALLRQRHQRR